MLPIFGLSSGIASGTPFAISWELVSTVPLGGASIYIGSAYSASGFTDPPLVNVKCTDQMVFAHTAAQLKIFSFAGGLGAIAEIHSAQMQV